MAEILALRKYYVPILKADGEQRIVEGYASTDTEDSQGEIIEPDVIQAALAGYMKFANVRAQHDPTKAVGKTKEAKVDDKGLYVTVKVVDDDAWNKVKEGVFNGFSVGLMVMKKIGKKITECVLKEISLVDRPANPDCVFDVVKAWDDAQAKTKNKEDKVAADTVEVKKSLYDVSALAQNLQSLHDVEECIEQMLEGNGRTSEAHKKLEQVVIDLAGVLNELTAEETATLIGGETREAKMANDLVPAPAAPAAPPTATATAAKADADPTLGHLKAIHGAMKAMKEACDAHKEATDSFHKAHKEAMKSVHGALKDMGYAAPKEDGDADEPPKKEEGKDAGEKADKSLESFKADVAEGLNTLAEAVARLATPPAQETPLPARTEIPEGVRLVGKADGAGPKEEEPKTEREGLRKAWQNPRPFFAQ